MNLTPMRCCGLALALAAPSALAQVSTSCIPTKNQVVLRQRVAELDAAQGRLDTRILQAEVDALQRRGMINDQQAAEFASIIEQAKAPKGPVDTPDGEALARHALESKVAELHSAESAPIPESNPEIHAQASAVLASKLKEMEPAPAPPPPDYSARHAVALAALTSVMTEMSAAAPVVDDDSDEAIRARAQAALAAKMAELDRQSAATAAATTATGTDTAAAAQRALAEKMAELDRQTAEASRPAPTPTAPPPPAAPVVTTPPPAAPAAVPPPAPAPEPPVAVVVAPGEDRRAATQAALEATMTDLNRQEGVSLTGVPVKAPPTAPGERLRATHLLRETVAAPFGVLETPPSPKTGWDRLNELTDLYRANQITPREYHTERAKIMESLAR